MMIWEYLKQCIVPHHPIKTHFSWGQLFPTQRIDPQIEQKSVPIRMPNPMVRWFLRGRRWIEHKTSRLGGQAPRATYSGRATPHR